MLINAALTKKTRVPPMTSPLMTGKRGAVLYQLMKFSVVGLIGFGVNLGTVYLLKDEIGLYLAGAGAFMTAASVTWLANRSWTFLDCATRPVSSEWLLYLCVNVIGFTMYYLTYSTLITLVPF